MFLFLSFFVVVVVFAYIEMVVFGFPVERVESDAGEEGEEEFSFLEHFGFEGF
jgi:hypothetical protein